MISLALLAACDSDRPVTDLPSEERLMEDTHWAVPCDGHGLRSRFQCSQGILEPYDSSIKWDRCGLVVSRRSLEAVSSGII